MKKDDKEELKEMLQTIINKQMKENVLRTIKTYIK